MPNSAGRVPSGNEGQTDLGRGTIEKFPTAAPAGRARAVTGRPMATPNDNSPDGLIRKSRGGGSENGAR